MPVGHQNEEVDDGFEPMPAWVVRRWRSWGAGVVGLVVVLGATSHEWWTMPLAFLLAGIVVGVQFLRLRRSMPSSPTLVPPSPTPATAEDGASEEDIVLVKPASDPPASP